MKIMESAEDYLEAILHISKEKEFVRAIDIVKRLEISKPSVSVYLKKLKTEGYVDINSDGHVSLTKSGLEIANKISERHHILAQMFINLGVSEKVAFEDACKIEHDLSDETFNAIRLHFNDSHS